MIAGMSRTKPTPAVDDAHTPAVDDAHTPMVNESISGPPLPVAPQETESSVKTLLGWTFFDPGNLLSILLLSSAAILAFNEMRQLSLSHTWSVIFYYGCIAAFLRSYFHYYYHGSRVTRVAVFVPLLLGILAGGAYWSDAAQGFEYLSKMSLRTKAPSLGFYWASLLNVMCAIALTVHLIMPRRWLVRITEDIENRVPDDLGVSIIKGRDTED
jgi:hypothetical protein